MKNLFLEIRDYLEDVRENLSEVHEDLCDLFANLLGILVFWGLLCLLAFGIFCIVDTGMIIIRGEEHSVLEMMLPALPVIAAISLPIIGFFALSEFNAGVLLLVIVSLLWLGLLWNMLPLMLMIAGALLIAGICHLLYIEAWVSFAIILLMPLVYILL